MKILIALLILAGLGIGVYTYNAQISGKTGGSSVDGNIPPSANTSGLTSVDYSNQGLTKFPADILSKTRTQALDLSRNALTGAIPAEIRFLQDLEVLNMSDNDMTGLPAELGQLKKLRILNVSNNRLTGIPHELGDLSSLQVLDLSGNDISKQDLDVIRARLPASTQILL
jgi:Leucine-rich repeat (LRR) protein